MKLLIVGFAAVVLVGNPSAGQDVLLPDLFADRIDVRVVNVEVVVTDHEGYRILGSEASDFELLVDGQPVPVSYFTEVDDGRAIASLDQAQLGHLDREPQRAATTLVTTLSLHVLRIELALGRQLPTFRA